MLMGMHSMWTNVETYLPVSFDIWQVLEQGNDYREDEHEANGKQQGPCQDCSTAIQGLLHVEVKA